METEVDVQNIRKVLEGLEERSYDVDDAVYEIVVVSWLGLFT